MVDPLEAAFRSGLPRANESQQSGGCVVHIGHATGQIGPSPTTRWDVGERMRLDMLTVQQPIETFEILVPVDRTMHRCASAFIARVVFHVARFVSIGQLPSGPNRCEQEFDTAADDQMFRQADTCQAHHDKTCQRRRFQEAAALRLHRFNYLQ